MALTRSCCETLKENVLLELMPLLLAKQNQQGAAYLDGVIAAHRVFVTRLDEDDAVILEGNPTPLNSQGSGQKLTFSMKSLNVEALRFTP